MKILNFNLFREKYTTLQTDDVNLTDKKNRYNTYESDNQEYLSKRTSLESIYTGYKDKKDLVTKLKLGGFIKDNPDLLTIQFINPLMSSYSTILDLKRKLKDLESFKKEATQEITDKLSAEKKLPTQKAEIQKQGELVSDQLSGKSEEISEVKTRISAAETKHQKFLLDYKKKMDDLSKEIQNFTNL
ncbi:hypothetical protein EBU71_14670, partial [bacterium]|nr:hypothetical protein [Candidatus Elulimicrobium humile]